MKIKNLLIASAAGALLGLSVCLQAADSGNSFINNLKQDWAVAKYETPRNKQDRAFRELIDKSEIYEAKHPKDAQAALWHGTVLATYASIKGGMGALKYAEASKASLEKSIELKSNVDQGFAQAVLGSLYARVPGWPISFGSKSQAEMHFKQALKMNPNGIDPNFYYGKYLIDNGRYEAAIPYLKKGLAAPNRPDFETADKGRKRELQELLDEAKRQ